jgi:hypothetical protein
MNFRLQISDKKGKADYGKRTAETDPQLVPL